MVLNRQQKEALVIELLNKGYTYPQIAKRAHVSFSEIKRIELMVTGDDKKVEDEEKQKEKTAKPIHCQAFEMFLQGRSPVQVAIDLHLETGKVMTFLHDFMRLQSMGKAATILKEYKDQLPPLVKLVEWLKKNDTRGKDIRYAIDSINNIKALEQQKNRLKQEVQSLKDEVQLLKEERDYLSDNGGDIKMGYA
jgi:hypothetical protein